MNRKQAIGTVALKSAGEGLATAIFSRYNVIDHDGDVTLPGAFTDGAALVVSGWNHATWQPGSLPVGRAVLRDRGDWAEADVQFFMETQAGLQTWLTLKALDGSPWSYGYEIIDSEPGTFRGQRVRMLKRLAVYEVSPVLRAAGIGTETVNLRSDPASRALQAAYFNDLCRRTGYDPAKAALQRAHLRDIRRRVMS